MLELAQAKLFCLYAFEICAISRSINLTTIETHITYVCLDSAITQNSWRTSAQRTYLVPTSGRSLNFDRARWAGRWSTGMLRISLCGANAMYFWPVWVSPSYCKLQRNPYCGRRIFPVFLMLGIEPLFLAWLNYQTSRVVIQT